MKSKELITRLQREGWVLRSTKGSRHIFVHPSKPGHISVPHPKKDLPKGTVNSVLKQAALKQEK